MAPLFYLGALANLSGDEKTASLTSAESRKGVEDQIAVPDGYMRELLAAWGSRSTGRLPSSALRTSTPSASAGRWLQLRPRRSVPLRAWVRDRGHEPRVHES